MRRDRRRFTSHDLSAATVIVIASVPAPVPHRLRSMLPSAAALSG